MEDERERCEGCGKVLEVGDPVTYTDDMRFWHDACFNEELVPFDQWKDQGSQPKPSKE